MSPLGCSVLLATQQFKAICESYANNLCMRLTCVNASDESLAAFEDTKRISTMPSALQYCQKVMHDTSVQAGQPVTAGKLVAKASVAQHSAPILAVAWANSVTQGVTSDRKGTIIAWSPHQAQELHRLGLHVLCLCSLTDEILLHSCKAGAEDIYHAQMHVSLHSRSVSDLQMLSDSMLSNRMHMRVGMHALTYRPMTCIIRSASCANCAIPQMAGHQHCTALSLVGSQRALASPAELTCTSSSS